MTNLPVFFTSVAAMAAKESMIFAQTPCFSSCSSAMDFAMVLLLMCFTALLPFITFIAFFIGVMAKK